MWAGTELCQSEWCCVRLMGRCVAASVFACVRVAGVWHPAHHSMMGERLHTVNTAPSLKHMSRAQCLSCCFHVSVCVRVRPLHIHRYSFLDARGVGALEGLRLGTVYQQVWDGDLQDSNWRPPKGYDGTPWESAADVGVLAHILLRV